jgi:hypothetical protein
MSSSGRGFLRHESTPVTLSPPSGYPATVRPPGAIVRGVTVSRWLMKSSPRPRKSLHLARFSDGDTAAAIRRNSMVERVIHFCPHKQEGLHRSDLTRRPTLATVIPRLSRRYRRPFPISADSRDAMTLGTQKGELCLEWHSMSRLTGQPILRPQREFVKIGRSELWSQAAE